MELLIITTGGTQIKVQGVPPGMRGQVEREMSLLLGEMVTAVKVTEEKQ
mgnify:CR=1 FL=1